MSKDTIMMKDYILRASSKPFDNWKSGGVYFSNEILYPKLMKSAIYDKKLELNFSGVENLNETFIFDVFYTLKRKNPLCFEIIKKYLSFSAPENEDIEFYTQKAIKIINTDFSNSKTREENFELLY